ncbi:MAG: multicopper oxidase family protein [Vulcanimicrobiaceae bacterium]
MQRRTFLTGAATSLMSVAALPRLAARAAAADTVEYTLDAAPLRFRAAPGVDYAGLAYNGTLPGPVLRLRHGQRVRVRFRNRTGEQSTVHWHGMILPNAMDGVAGITQPPVPGGGEFVYEFAPDPPGTRWYHSHVFPQAIRGLFGVFVVEDPGDERYDRELVVVFHDVPSTRTLDLAMQGRSNAPMVDPFGSPELRAMKPGDRMGDEVAYLAHCINGATYPHAAPVAVNVGDRVRVRVLNANPSQTRYVRLAAHTLHVTHADGNRLAKPLAVDALRVGVAERYDAWFEVTRPGAWLLQSVSSDPLAFEQALVVSTPGHEHDAPVAVAQTLADTRYFTYALAGDAAATPLQLGKLDVDVRYELGGGRWGVGRWTMNGAVWPDTEKIRVHRGDRVAVRFSNKTDMDHPMHLHGHVFEIVEINGRALRSPLAKDVALVPADGGTMTWRFAADSPAGRWLLHCHNEVHMMSGLMTEVVYV